MALGARERITETHPAAQHRARRRTARAPGSARLPGAARDAAEAMGSLDQFLADLDDLNEEQNDGGDDDGEPLDALEEEDDDLDMLADDDADEGVGRAATGLLMSDRLRNLMESIEAAMGSADPDANADVDEGVYGLIVRCNEMVIDVDNEIEAIAKTIRDEYAKRFPELESLILNPLDYARVVLKLGNETDLTQVGVVEIRGPRQDMRAVGPSGATTRLRSRTPACTHPTSRPFHVSQVDLTGILPSATVMVVTVTASTTVGTPLPAQTLASVTDLCEQVLELPDARLRTCCQLAPPPDSCSRDAI